MGRIGLVKELLLMQILIWPPASAAPKGEWGLRPFFHLLIGWPLSYIPMSDLPWVKWYPHDWASEPGLRLCDLETRAVWFEALNTMFLLKASSLSGTAEQLAALCRCSKEEIVRAVEQLERTKVAEVYEQNGNKILTCRKLARDCTISELRAKAGRASGTKRQHAHASVCEHPSPSPSPSPSTGLEGGLGEERVTEARIPSEAEWMEICKMEGLPEWKARDEFLKQQATYPPWAKACGNLHAHAARVRTWWQRDGCPKEMPSNMKGPNGNHQTRQPSNPRLVGVAPSSDYSAASDKLAGKIPQRPAA